MSRSLTTFFRPKQKKNVSIDRLKLRPMPKIQKCGKSCYFKHRMCVSSLQAVWHMTLRQTSHVCVVISGGLPYDVLTTRLSDHTKWRSIATKGGNFPDAITHNVIWTNEKTKSCVYLWQCAQASLDVTCFSAFVGASDVISSVPSIR